MAGPATILASRMLRVSCALSSSGLLPYRWPKWNDAPLAIICARTRASRYAMPPPITFLKAFLLTSLVAEACRLSRIRLATMN